MAHRDIAVPEENCEYPVVLGRSLFAATGDATSDEAQEGDSGDAAYALFQYKFTPASVDTTIPGLVSMDDDSTSATVLRGTTAKSFADGGISFKGKIAEQKDTECLLIFDGTSFRLERCDYVLSQLRHVRTAPLQRPPPSAYPAPMGKKNLLPGVARRIGKLVKPAKRTRKATAKNTADDSVSSEVAKDSSEHSSDLPTGQSSAPTPVATAIDGEDTAALDSPSSKRRRQDE